MNNTPNMIEQMAAYFGDEHRPEVFMRMAENEPLMAAVWGQYQAAMADGEIDVPAKELIGLGVAIAKPNEYVTGLQQLRVRRVGVDLAGEREAFAVAALFEGLGAFARCLCVDRDLHPRGEQDACAGGGTGSSMVLYVDQPAAEVQQVYDDIMSVMGLSSVPNIFRAMGHNANVLQAKWNCYKAVMLEGTLPRLTKELIAIAVSAVGGCEYCTSANSAVSRQLGLTEPGLVEVAGVVDLFVSLCTLAKGYRLGKRNL